jgi:DNA-binding transcriptional LysR family regulator
MLPSRSPVRDLLSHPGVGSPHIETNSVSALYSHVRSGGWMSVLPQSLASESQTGSDLQAIPLAPSGNAVAVAIMIPDRELTFALAEEFFNVAVSMTHDSMKQQLSA